MILGAYLCSGSLFLTLSFLLILQRRELRSRFLLVSLALMLGMYLAFELLSAPIGLTTYGQPGNYRYPQDYLSAGWLGWLAFVTSILGVVSPLLVAGILRFTGREQTYLPFAGNHTSGL